MKRRDFIQTSAIATLAIPASGCNTTKPISKSKNTTINHSVCRWCYNNTPLEELADQALDIGISSIELLNIDEWDVVLKRGLNCAISNGISITISDGFNDPSLHGQFLDDYKRLIPAAAEKGIPNIICFSGNKRNLSDEEGLEHCAQGLEPILKIAEKYNVNVIMELLNSKVDHIDYQCDHSEWGVALVEKLGSPNFKLLYDIYHMQIMEGDIISTITKYKDHIAHFHTGGVPGRNEIDETQEINYKAVMDAIKENGFKGYVAQEFIPTWKDPFKALSKAIDICSV